MICQFALRLVFGMSLMWCVVPRRLISVGFFRIQMLVCLGLSVLAVMSVGKYPTQVIEGPPILSESIVRWGGILLACVSFCGSVLWTLGRRSAGAISGGITAVVSMGTLVLSTFSMQGLTTASGLLSLGGELATSAVLGSAMVGMLLGHWYLTSPTMSIAPLHRLIVVFAGSVGLRCVISAISMAVYWQKIVSPTHWLWLTLRWAAGLIGPLVIAFMAWKILKFRNTQSATGVLFVGVILTFIGELVASLLYQELLIAF